MTIETELPPGWIICRKGGRPPRVARDMAVLSASIWLDLKDVHTKKADEWIIEKFNFSDRSQVRRALRKAKQEFPGPWGAFTTENLVAIVTMVGCGISQDPNAIGWAWREGMTEAVQINPATVKFYPHPESNRELMEVQWPDVPDGQ